MRKVDRARGRAAPLLALLLKSTLPPDVVVLVRLRTRLVSLLRQFVVPEAFVAEPETPTALPDVVPTVAEVDDARLLSLVLVVLLVAAVLLVPLIVVGQGALLSLRCVALTPVPVAPVFCAVTPGATNAPSATAIPMVRLNVLRSNMLPSNC
jgi:hypothetical protein